jgi:hypothetical protein
MKNLRNCSIATSEILVVLKQKLDIWPMTYWDFSFQRQQRHFQFLLTFLDNSQGGTY